MDGEVWAYAQKEQIAERYLRAYPEMRKDDGGGAFLNKVVAKHCPYGIDFRTFKVEGWARARRTVMGKFPELDERTKRVKG